MKAAILIWKFWYFLLNLVSIILVAPIIIILSYFPNTFHWIYSLIKFWANFVFYGIGMRFDIEGSEILERNQNYIIISNHTSVMDVLLMVLLHPQHPLSFVGKKELSKIPLFGTAYKRICVMVDRKSLKSRAGVYDRSLDKLKEGRSMVIFPEGGVTEAENENLLPFKEGAFTIAKNANIPIVVYSILGMKKAFPFDFWKGKPSKIKVHLEKIFSHKEIENQTEKELKNEAYSLIDNRLKKALTN